ncbi:ATP-binding protein [Nucisporomicrobium flavum]|uniref:ATP-binding protein n=1 Tax=Nucisporomicrobium flavum TaxID=2785915 RepID=UPI0018F48AF4|nr:ATP-binding protein [Nucisporomicrobium flavum]
MVSELVSNASMHANTMMTLQIGLRSGHLRIAVFDGSAAHAVARQAGSDGVGGRGLLPVDAVSAAEGSTALDTGKVVWSALGRSGSS